jgi:hypothetical protein
MITRVGRGIYQPFMIVRTGRGTGNRRDFRMTIVDFGFLIGKRKKADT